MNINHDALCAQFKELHLDDKSTDHLTLEELQLYRLWFNGWDCGSDMAFDRAKAIAIQSQQGAMVFTIEDETEKANAGEAEVLGEIIRFPKEMIGKTFREVLPVNG